MYPHINLVYIFNLIICSYLMNVFFISTGTISSFPSSFDKTNVMFLKLLEDLNNSVGGSSSVGDNSGEFNGKLTHNYLNLFLTLNCCFNLFRKNYSTISDS